MYNPSSATSPSPSAHQQLPGQAPSLSRAQAGLMSPSEDTVWAGGEAEVGREGPAPGIRDEGNLGHLLPGHPELAKSCSEPPGSLCLPQMSHRNPCCIPIPQQQMWLFPSLSSSFSSHSLSWLNSYSRNFPQGWAPRHRDPKYRFYPFSHPTRTALFLWGFTFPIRHSHRSERTWE